MTDIKIDDKQIDGQHYKTAYQHWSMLPDIGYDSQYYAGQVSKYLMRWRKKNGSRDVLKAQHFIEKMLELAHADTMFLAHGGMERTLHHSLVTSKIPFLQRFYASNEMPEPEQVICTVVLFARTPDDLESALEQCMLLAEAAAEEERAQPPPEAGFTFIEYTQDDTDKMIWVCKKCNETLSLNLDQPPNMHHTC